MWFRTLSVCILIMLSRELFAYKERYWHEETFKAADVSIETLENLKGMVLYPRLKRCVRPQKETKISKRSKNSKKLKQEKFEGRWSRFLGLYYFDSGFEIHNWELIREEPDPDVQPWTESASLFLVLFLIMLFLIFCTLWIPIVGWFGFHIYRAIWWVCSHPVIKILARKFWIYNEQRKRRRLKWLHLGDKSKSERRQSVLPYWLRKFKEEETPDVLKEHEIESDGGDSSDGFELDYYTKEDAEAFRKQQLQQRHSKDPEGQAETVVVPPITKATPTPSVSAKKLNHARKRS